MSEKQNITKLPVAAAASAPPDAEEAAFLFDEFFETPEQKTFDLPLVIGGRRVIFKVKKGLSNADRNAAEMAAIKYEELPGGKGVKMTGIDESKLTLAMVMRAIVSWPFKHADGSPVPVTMETVAALKGGAENILTAINKYDTEGEAGLKSFQDELSAPAQE